VDSPGGAGRQQPGVTGRNHSVAAGATFACTKLAAARSVHCERRDGRGRSFAISPFTLHRGLAIPVVVRRLLYFRVMEGLDRITADPEQCGGRPCIRGMRIRVSDVLDLFAAGLTAQQIMEEMPDLELDDLRAVLLFASRWLDHPVLVA
jgi:uncharacterized protein (DUF433 family)